MNMKEYLYETQPFLTEGFVVTL